MRSHEKKLINQKKRRIVITTTQSLLNLKSNTMKNTVQRYCFFTYPPNILHKKYVLQHVFLCFDKSIWQKYTNFHFFSPKIWSIQIKAVPLHPVSKTKLFWNKIGAVVQLVRIHACHAWGRGFESRPHRKEDVKASSFFCIFTYLSLTFS